ncbi:hypothetical protein Bca52824_041079 [Brassica carinata]|uniref:Uncharacterized protein n=1 Tax=Brassica carinata TaxID=52824 RepID=A0A8X7RU74_BRACI|nr:hypothetical protein Bca52824_041079 [Brassica carinata]
MPYSASISSPSSLAILSAQTPSPLSFSIFTPKTEFVSRTRTRDLRSSLIGCRGPFNLINGRFDVSFSSRFDFFNEFLSKRFRVWVLNRGGIMRKRSIIPEYEFNDEDSIDLACFHLDETGGFVQWIIGFLWIFKAFPEGAQFSMGASVCQLLPQVFCCCAGVSLVKKCHRSRPQLDRWEEATGEAVDEVIFLSRHTAVNPRLSRREPRLPLRGVSGNGGEDPYAFIQTEHGNLFQDFGSSSARARIIIGDGMLSDESTSEALAVRRLLGHRLPTDAHKAKKDWYDIVEGNPSLWDGVARIFF